LCVFIFTAETFAQAHEKDSLDQYSYETLTEKFQKTRFTKTNLAKLYLAKIFEIAKTEQDPGKLYFSHRNLAKIEDLIGNTEEALQQIDIAIAIASEKLKDAEKVADCIFTKAYISYNAGLYEEAFLNYTKAYDYYKNTDFKNKTNYISINIALIKNILGDQDGAIKLLLNNYNNYQSLSLKDKEEQYGNSSYSSILLALSDAYVRKSIKNPDRKNVLLDSASTFNTAGLEKTIETNNRVTHLGRN
jgi:tetratricopeptide (TPR) repeat protein